MGKVSILLMLCGLILPSGCVTPSGDQPSGDLEIDCYAAQVHDLKDYFAIKCYPDNLTSQSLQVQIDQLRFPNFENDITILVPDREMLPETTLLDGPEAVQVRFAQLPPLWFPQNPASKEAALVLSLLYLAQVAGRMTAPPPPATDIRKEYREQYLLNKSIYLKPMERSQGLILARTPREGQIPETIELSLSQPDHRSVIVPIKIDIRLLRMRLPKVSGSLDSRTQDLADSSSSSQPYSK